MSEKSMATIEKLKGREDYVSWKFAVQAYLEHEELWDCVAPIEGVSVDSKKDVKARSKLILLVDPMNYIHIQEAKSAKEVWTNLGKAFDDSGLTRRVGLLRELITTSLENCTSIEDYVNKIMTSAHKLRNIGFEVKDEWLGTLLLTGLPDQYKPMLMALESSGVAITADLVKTKLLQEVKSSETGVFFTNRKKLQPIKQGGTSKGPRCYSCNKYGHISRNCKAKANSNKKSDAKCDSNSFAAAFSTTINSNSGWFVDSGAAMHMTMNRSWLYDEAPPPVSSVRAAINKELKVVGCGKVNLNVTQKDGTTKLIQVTSLGGARHFLTFIDDFSRKVCVFTLKSKSECLNKFKEYKCLVENQLNVKIKTLRTDNGTEYKNKEFADFLRSSGIKHQTSTPYSPQQNGLAERMNRTLVEKARCMLINANLQKYLWAEAVVTAAYIVNRSPTRALDWKTPEEKWSGKQPIVSHMRVFGCEAMMHIPKEKVKKWDSRSRKMIFLGYCDNSKGYRLLDIKSRTVMKSRDVIFLENSVKRDFVTVPLSSPESEKQVSSDVLESDADDNSDLSTHTAMEHSEVEVTDDPDYVPERPIDLPERSNITLRPRNKKNAETEPKTYICSNDVSSCSVPETYTEAIMSKDSHLWVESINEELKAHDDNGTWQLVEKPPEAKVMGCKWVFRIKDEQTHWNAVKRVFKYLKETKRFGLCYRSNENSTIEGFSDADYANDPVTRRSTTGYVFMKNGGAVTWCSQRQPTVALSTTEAEFMAACCATKETLWIRQLMCDIGQYQQGCMTLKIDNQSAISLIKNSDFHKRCKHIDVKRKSQGLFFHTNVVPCFLSG
ncbi:hypothetical protein ABMA27_014049 [Loxostege sticticalis]|uniref:Retrovirus-related Pol polyprotein from transposon TNT 1-94 n=1 Tax=Loxostege sticticalis TaxID=481309 RepID=A0ABR3ICH2_LOXSC